MVSGVFATIYGPILIELSESFNISLESIGLVFSLYSIGIVSGAILYVILDGVRINLKTRLNIFFMIILCSLALMFIFSVRALFMVCVFICSICSINLQITCLIMVSDYSRKNQNLLITFSTFFIALGALLGSILGPFIINCGLSYKFIFLIIFIILLIVFIFSNVVKIYDNNKIKNFKLTKINLSDLFKNFEKLIVILLGINIFFLFSIEQLINQWLPSFLRISKDLSINFAGNTLAFFWIFMTIGRFIFGIIAEKFDILKLSIFLCILLIITLIFIHISKETILSFFLFGISGFFLASLYPFSIGISTKYFQHRKNLIITYFLICGFLGSSFNNVIIIKVIEKIGINYFIPFILILGFILLSLYLFVFYLTKKSRKGKLKIQTVG
jgi:MFS family permease